jgi:hypothetical protein
MFGKIAGVLVTGGVGIVIARLGWLVWKKQKLTLLHDYHTDKVSPENRPAFCKLSGNGLIVIGVGALLSAALLGLTGSACSFICFAAGFAAGLAMLIKAGRKYNR